MVPSVLPIQEFSHFTRSLIYIHMIFVNYCRSTTMEQNHNNPANMIRDEPNWFSNIKDLRETDVIILLTPVVDPISQNPIPSDPFEPLGQSLAKRHSSIRQIPYTQRSGGSTVMSIN